MKKILSFTIVLFAFVTMQAQNQTVYSDNFDSYTAGQSLYSQNSTNWTTWSGGTEAESGTIVSDIANSTPNSLKITTNNDMICKCNAITTGHYTVDFDYYIPSSGNGAYFNMLHKFSGSSSVWAYECYFGEVVIDSTLGQKDYFGILSYTDTFAYFQYTPDSWFHVNIDVNLDADNIVLNIAGEQIQSWQFSSLPDTTNNTMLKLDAINFFSGCIDNILTENSTLSGTYYVDNLVITKLAGVGINENSENDVTVYPNPASDFINVSNAENAQITLFDIRGKVMAEIESATAEQVIDINKLANGTYFLRIKDGNSVTTKKVVVAK